jgi:hypothetical protein
VEEEVGRVIGFSVIEVEEQLPALGVAQNFKSGDGEFRMPEEAG